MQYDMDESVKQDKRIASVCTTVVRALGDKTAKLEDFVMFSDPFETIIEKPKTQTARDVQRSLNTVFKMWYGDDVKKRKTK